MVGERLCDVMCMHGWDDIKSLGPGIEMMSHKAKSKTSNVENDGRDIEKGREYRGEGEESVACGRRRCQR